MYFECFYSQTLLRIYFPFLFFSLLKYFKAFQKFPEIQALPPPIKIAGLLLILAFSILPQSLNIWNNCVLPQTT